MCTLWSACTECAVMNRNAMPCLAMPCLALPCHIYIYNYIYCLVQRWCVQAAVLVLFLFPEGRMFSVAPSPIDIVWWKIRTRVKTTVPRSEIFSVFCRLQMIFNLGSLQNYLETSLYAFQCFFLHNHAVKLTSLHFRLQQGFLNNLDLGPQDLVLPTWCLWTWDCIAIDNHLERHLEKIDKNSWLFWFSFAATNVLNESATGRTLFLLIVSAVSGTA